MSASESPQHAQSEYAAQHPGSTSLPTDAPSHQSRELPKPPLNLALDRLEDAHGYTPPEDAVYEEFVAWA